MSVSPSRLALRIALLYATAALLWVVLTELALARWLHGFRVDFAGWHFLHQVIFIALTSGLLYLLARHGTMLLSRAERALRDQQERERRAIEVVGDGVWETDLATGRTCFSPRWKKILGYEPHEIGDALVDWRSRIHPTDVAVVDAAMARSFHEPGAGFRCEYRMRASDGSYRWVLGRGSLVDGGRRLLGTHTDITDRKNAEAELHAALERYRQLFEANPQPMWIYDEESLTVLAVNDAAVRKYGYAREQFVGLSITALRPPEDVPTFLDLLTKLTGKLEHSGPWRHRRADGSLLTVQVTAHAVEWEGRAARLVLAHDVTDETLARRALEESREKLSAIFQSANDAIFIADARARITDCNPRALELFRTTAKAMVGRWVPAFFPPTQPDGTASLKAARAVLREARERALGPFEWTNRREDGSTFPAEITISPLRFQQHEGFVIVVRDLTERRRATDQLQLLHAALRATPTGWMITDARGTIQWVNPAFTRITGYEAEEVNGRNPRVLRSGHHSHEFYTAMWSTIARGDVWKGDLRNQRKDGTHYDEHMVIAPVRNASGETTHFVAMKHDITAERSLEQQLSRAQRLESIGMLASGIAHDLNNVLTPISLCIEFMKLEFPTESAAAKLSLIAQAAERGAGIVRQVLTFARGVEGEKTALQPAFVLKEVGQLARETLPRNIEVRIEGTREEGRLVEGDVTQLHQALFNLVVNARDAMPMGGRLSLRRADVEVDEARARRNAIAPGVYVELSVEDTGTGIPEEALEKIFDPFFSTKPRGKGTGLGLSTVYGIARGHRGAVEVDTQWGRGTTFRLLLPAMLVPRAAAPLNGAIQALEGRERLILVVDDEEPIRRLISHLLRKRGFNVVDAADGVEALARFRSRSGKWAGAITDMMMPRMDGMTLSRELRALDPELPILGMSGMVDDADAEEAGPIRIEPGLLCGMMAKPFNERELVDALLAALGEAPGMAAKKNV